MTTRKEASGKVYDAIVKLLLAYDTAPASGKTNLTIALKGLYAEYSALQGKPNLLSKPYSVLTAELKQSANALQRVAKDRTNLANSLVSAAQLLSTVTAVLGLIV